MASKKNVVDMDLEELDAEMKRILALPDTPNTPAGWKISRKRAMDITIIMDNKRRLQGNPVDTGYFPGFSNKKR